eukprot:1760777-Pyramimonas_sp.AAC.1
MSPQALARARHDSSGRNLFVVSPRRSSAHLAQMLVEDRPSLELLQDLVVGTPALAAGVPVHAQ